MIGRVTAIILLCSVSASDAAGTVLSCGVENRYRLADNGKIVGLPQEAGSLTKIIVDSSSGAVIDERPLPSGMRWKVVGKFTRSAAASIKFIGYDKFFNAALTLVIFAKDKGSPFLYEDLRSGRMMSGACRSK